MTHDRRLAQLTLFAVVGVTSAAAYVGANWALVEFGQLSPNIANVCAFLCAMSISYFGHLKLTFRADPHHQVYGPKFIVQAMVTFAVTAGVTVLGAALNLHYLVPVAINLVLIPASSYLILKAWVFATPRRHPRD